MPSLDRADDFHNLKVVVLDVDGTLYRQAPLRRAMAMRLLKAHLWRPLEGWRTLRALTAYRRAQEVLRDAAPEAGSALDQLSTASARAGLDPQFVNLCVSRWMEKEPLTVLKPLRYPGLIEFLLACRNQGIVVAALSDYPAEAKLHALGIAELFDEVFCAQSPEIGVFKPHPRGLLVAMKRFGVSADQCLYIGDRADVDAAAADAAGIRSVIISSRRVRTNEAHRVVPGYAQLRALLFPGRKGESMPDR